MSDRLSKKEKGFVKDIVAGETQKYYAKEQPHTLIVITEMR